ncbi:FKBP-type peptidyl-prolyl cis-trans isomerase [Flexithrix dorotheae]|uniref:FKBP-type peptidyl-prolyl cis-trans isomerase n=1 Tax=Flexithrix dorotheae TaxID=70993 RepID=UPI0003724661|nr:FKBP-type peptidyl-prolyl cis-trans isomerase [Flexithrix dorotheae]
MKNGLLIFLAVLFVTTAFAQSKKELKGEIETLKLKADSLGKASEKLQSQINEFESRKKVDMNDEMQKLSYAIGILIGENLKKDGLLDSITAEVFTAALEDVKNGNQQMPPQEASQFVQTLMEGAQKKKFEKNIEEGKKFLEENAKRDGVVTLPSGLQYEVLVEGNGAKPTANDKVTTHYHGTLIDGTVFDSSVERGQPATFGVGQVIKGWTEALLLMPEGSKWKLFLPYDLAYGERGAGGAIGPYATLVFEVELIKIEK